MRYEFHPKVKNLLQNKSNEKVTMTYIEHKWTLPKISKRPPYYKNPIYTLK